MQHILVAADFSDRSRAAVRRAALLASEHGARLTMLHVLEDWGLNERGFELQRMADEFQHALAKEIEEEFDVKCVLKMDSGAIWDAILFHGEQLKPDLLVLGRQRESPWKEFFRGTNVDRVLRHARIPTLVVVSDDIQPYTRIVAGVDFSDSAKQGLRVGHELAPKARVDAVHAYPPEGERSRHGRNEEELGAMLKSLLAEELPGVEVDQTVEQGWPYRLFSKAAANDGSKLLLLGKHSRNALDATVIGGTTESCLATPFCDILLAPGR